MLTHPTALAVGERTNVFVAKQKLRTATSQLPSRNATTAGVEAAVGLALDAAELLRAEVIARAQDTAQKKAGYDPTAILYDKLGRPRSPAAMPGYRAGQAPASKGRKYPPTPLSLKEIVKLLNEVGTVSKNAVYAERLRALILILWRTGMRISEALQLQETDLNPQTSHIYIRRGKGGKARDVGVDAWIWDLIKPWLELRAELPPGPLFCVVEGRTAGVDAWGHSQIRRKFGDLQRTAKVRKRFRPHQLRHTLTVELVMEGTSIVIVQRQLGHANLAVTTNYTAGLPQEEVFEAMRSRQMPTVPAFELAA